MQKNYVFILFFLLLRFSGFCQSVPDSSYIDITSVNDSSLAINKTMLFFDSNEVADIKNIARQQFVPFLKYAYYRKHIPTHLVPKTVYLLVALYNSSVKKDTILFFPGSMFDKLLFYEQKADGSLIYSGDGTSPGFCKLALDPAEKKVFIVQLNFGRHAYNYLKPQLIRPGYLTTYESVYRSSVEGIRSVGFLLSGVLLLMIIFVVVNYTQSFKKEFLYYLGYAVSMFLLVLLYAILGTSWGGFTSFFNGYLDLFLLILGNVFYLAFTRQFLNTWVNYKLLDRIFKAGELFLLFAILVFTLIHYFTEWYLGEIILENLMKIIVLGIGILFIIIAFKQKQRLIIYLALGSAFAIFFSLISLYIILFNIPAKSIFSTALFYHDIALVFALSFFLLGLAYKNRRELIERTQEQESLKLDVEKKILENQIAIIKAQQEERNRISADMHDDLGAGMTTIRLYSELAKARLGDTQIPEIEKISSSANELLNKMNAIIWSMSSSNDSLGNMIAYIRSYSLEYFENTGVNCKISLPEGLPNVVVNGEIRRNVFLVVKEALNNILKHAKATEVTINLERVPDGLKLYIHDNGTGIDFEKLRQFGNGLKNMKKRMEDVNINFSIENNNGTLITLHRVIATF
jgi:signal transduction histidine kinase